MNSLDIFAHFKYNTYMWKKFQINASFHLKRTLFFLHIIFLSFSFLHPHYECGLHFLFTAAFSSFFFEKSLLFFLLHTLHSGLDFILAAPTWNLFYLIFLHDHLMVILINDTLNPLFYIYIFTLTFIF